jgi:inner membrane protein
MPTPLTHAIVGASFAAALPPSKRRFGYAAGLGFLAASPDLDILGFFLGVSYLDPLGHRGLFHSFFVAALVSAIVAAAIAGIRARPFRPFVLIFLAMSSHGLLDAMTNGGRGVGLLQPFHAGRFFLPLRPIEGAAIHPSSLLNNLVSVLRSEIVWVWLPTLCLVACIEVYRHRNALTQGLKDRNLSSAGTLEPAPLAQRRQR